MTTLCKTYVSEQLNAEVEENKPAEGLEGDEKKAAEDAFKKWGVAHMTRMCKQLIAGGVTQLHFYCLNLDSATKEVLKGLGYLKDDYSDETCQAYAEEGKEHRGVYTA